MGKLPTKVLSGQCEIGGVVFQPRADCNYMHDYIQAAKHVRDGTWNEQQAYRHLVMNDLWFVVYFVLKVPIANHPFWVQACRDVQEGPKSSTLDLWAREHGKSTILTTAEPIQLKCRSFVDHNRDERIGIFSHSRPIAKAFLRSIKMVLENSEFLKYLFPDVFYADPVRDSPKWSEDEGLICKRRGFYKESCFEAWGLIEGMPTSKHFTHRIYDDVETDDLVQSPDMIEKCKHRYDLSENLGTLDGTDRTIGTIYHHDATLCYLWNKKTADGEPIFHVRRKPATVDGTFNGEPVLLPKPKLEKLKANKRTFFTQQLLDPTPTGERTFDPAWLKVVSRTDIPTNLYKFMTVDPAGDQATSSGTDSWSILVCGVEPYRDDLGASSVYILDACIEPMTHTEAMNQIVRMYLGNGRIRKVGVERFGASTIEIHVANALRKKGRIVSVETGNLQILTTGGRKKQWRIENSLQWALQNGKIKISNTVPKPYIDRLHLELEKFPYWKDDGLDALSYLYDMIALYKFSDKPSSDKDSLSSGWRKSRFTQRKEKSRHSFLYN